MQIALDVSCLAKAEKSGIGVYARNLVDGLARAGRDNVYHLCYRLSRLKHYKHFYRVRQDNFRLKIIQEPLNPFFPGRIDVFHGLDARLPGYGKPAKVVTLHDLFSLISDKFSDEAFIAKKKKRYAEVARNADRIITVSRSTRRDIVERLGYPEERIDVVPLGVDPVFGPVGRTEADRVLERHGIEGPYVFFVGNVSARKNLVRVLEAFASLHPSIRGGLSIVMAGQLTYGGDKVLEAVERLELRESVKVLGYVPFADLPALYSAAEVFMFPTLYEGFGIPILEAMACGTAVVASNLSSHPEVAGEAAVLVDPTDAEAIGSALEKLIEDNDLRNTCVDKGLERAAAFTWDNTVRETIAVYEKMA